MEFKEVIERGYKSTAIVWGCARNKWSIVKERSKQAHTKQLQYEEDTPEFIAAQKEKNRWADLITRLAWLWKFADTGFGSQGMSMRHMLEDMYKLAGYDIADLIDFNSYDFLQILSPVSFTEEPSLTDMAELEAEFIPEDAIFRLDNDVETQYIALFNYLLLDVYRFMAMGLWFDSQLDRTSVPGPDADMILDIWDTMIESAKNFLFQSRNCFADTEIESKVFFENKELEGTNLYHTTRAKYFKTKENTLIAAGGLFAVNLTALTPTQANKVEHLPLQYIQGS